MRKIQAVLVVGILLGWAAGARAYTNFGSSVEWLATFRPVIVEGKVTAVGERSEKKFDGSTAIFVGAKLTCDVTKVHKGKIEGPIVFSFQGYKGDSELGDVGTHYLLYLDVNEETGKTVVTDYVNLDAPGGRFVPGVAYSKAGKILRTKGEILETLEGRLKLLEKSGVADFGAFSRGAPETLMIEAPGESAMSLWAGSGTFLRVPADAEFEAGFLARARELVKEAAGGLKSVDSASAGALFPLAFYSDEKANEVMRAALKDMNRLRVRLRADAESHTPARELTVYPLRQGAYEILKARGEKVDAPEGMTAYFRMENNGERMNVVYRAPGAKRDLYVAAQPAK